MTYPIETRAEASITKRLLRRRTNEALEMHHCNTLRDRIRNEDIRNACEMDHEMARNQRADVNRMTDNRLAKIAKNRKHLQATWAASKR